MTRSAGRGAGRLDRSRTDWLRDRKGRRREEDLGGKEEGFYSPSRRVFHPAEWPGKRLIRSFQDHRPFDKRNWREGRRCDCWRTPVGHWVSFRDGAAEVFLFFFFWLRRPRPTVRLFLSPFLLLPATLLLLRPLLYSSNPNSNSLPVCQSSIRFWTQFDPARWC